MKGGDRISSLPDEILIHILSSLELEEAARTSVLSTRWKNLWKLSDRLLFYDPRPAGKNLRIHFDDLMSLRNDSVLFSNLTEEQLEPADFTDTNMHSSNDFIDWVNNILKSHEAVTIKQFAVSFLLVDDDTSKNSIEGWINFALQRRVQWLGFDLSGVKGSYFGYFAERRYVLSAQTLSNFNLDNLEVLRLNFVEVSEEVVEYILMHCPSLRVLGLGNSDSLDRLKIAGPSLRLKCLDIVDCLSLKYINISDSNLVSFKYSGCAESICLKNVPHLIEATFEGRYACSLIKDSAQFSNFNYMSQLERLAIDFTDMKLQSFPKFFKSRNLRKLEIWLNIMFVDNLIFCTSLLQAFPMLEELSLKFLGLPISEVRHNKAKQRKSNWTHQHLKKVKVGGFFGGIIDVELLHCLLEVAVSLQTVVINPCSVYGGGFLYKYFDPDQFWTAITSAKQLETSLPPGAKLIFEAWE